MSVRLTDPANVALYDSVTGHAFGEVFDSAELAEDFLDWLGVTWPAMGDPRAISPGALGVLRRMWQTARVDPETGLLYEGAVAA